MKVDVIYTEDCQKGMPKRLPDGCVDLMPTDPPYGIAFMGREWDKFNEVVRPQGAYENVKGFKRLPRQSTASMEEFFVPRWQECLRVLKSGGFAFVMCSPRADVMATQILCLQEAGFMVGFTPIFWAYASGFPKAQNIGKAVDKRLGAKREVVGKGKSGKAETHKISYQMSQQENNTFGGEFEITKASSPQAQALDGSYAGFQPKPAVEVILVAMKPLSEKTYVDQALRNRKGITWLGNGKIPYKAQEDIDDASNKNRHADFDSGPRNNKVYGADKRSRAEQGNYDASKGRFPANLLCSDDALNDGRVQKSGRAIRHNSGGKTFGGENIKPKMDDMGYGDSGSFSRYFSLDAWFEKKLKELPKSMQKTFPFLIISKASKAEKNRGCEELYWEKDNSSFGYHQIDRQRWIWLGKEEERIYKETGKRVSLRARGNIHPTTKNIKLMSYLITLGSRKGDIILDPFIGSGTTAIAASMLGRRYIGFETDKNYCEIAKKRLSEVQLRLI